MTARPRDAWSPRSAASGGTKKRKDWNSMTTTCCENVRRLVRWNIVFLKPGHERTYPEREELISSCMSEAEFRNWKIAELVRAENLPAADGCYLRVHTEVLRSYEEPPWDFESE